jgi:hypothetical protein
MSTVSQGARVGAPETAKTAAAPSSWPANHSCTHQTTTLTHHPAAVSPLCPVPPCAALAINGVHVARKGRGIRPADNQEADFRVCAKRHVANRS